MTESANTGAPAAAGESPSSYYVQSLERGLEVIRAFDAEHPSMTLTDVARVTGLTRATARRFLLTLTDLGYVRTDGKHFELTARVLRLGYAFVSSHDLPQLAEPVLEELSGAVGESASASVLDGDQVVYIARVHTRRIMRVGISVGTRFPAYATSMGRVLLAFSAEPRGSTGGPGGEYDVVARLSAGGELAALTQKTITEPEALRAELARVRDQGWCLVDQELERGLSSLAVPVRGPDGTVVAALNVSMSVGGPGAEASAEERAVDLLPHLQAAAAQVEEALALRR
ncbi:IclR family transcriptional regulator domain-containing protein [Zhihengliuella halotolerans]|uniref:Glycerol operon regulatory protein n=1 Tax=Zhihengliuella halotolerans TaxID=370736 RepID=A0A4Q8AEB5_9MICC|nr:IclR family transcriptional regulator C-terminal domain-containing protein [Zhihengliuella halotolerans]RZU62568.1 IclR family transcriptional regulator [Zhihengliuella halotolerans]